MKTNPKPRFTQVTISAEDLYVGWFVFQDIASKTSCGIGFLTKFTAVIIDMVKGEELDGGFTTALAKRAATTNQNHCFVNDLATTISHLLTNLFRIFFVVTSSIFKSCGSVLVPTLLGNFVLTRFTSFAFAVRTTFIRFELLERLLLFTQYTNLRFHIEILT